MDCIFCKIISGEIPSDKVFENEHVLAFKDLDPKAPFHTLVIPKQHISDLTGINENNSNVIAKVYEAISLITNNPEYKNGFRVVCNCGQDGGQTVGHLHFHILAGRNLSWPPG